jgi:hypothetical protein
MSRNVSPDGMHPGRRHQVMKGTVRRAALGLLVAALVSPLHAAQYAQARFYSLSLRFQQGTEDFGIFTLDLSTIDIPGPANGELAPTYGRPTHVSGFRLYDLAWDTTVEGVLAFNVLMNQDANQNGFADFFEVCQGISGTTTGLLSIPFLGDSGTVQARWNREAGSKEGTCVLQMTSEQYGELPAFTHTFEVAEYSGLLSYTPGADRVVGSVDLHQIGAPVSIFAGPVEFLKAPTDPHNQLELQAGAWTNTAGERLTFLPDTYWRSLLWLTNYYGYLEFDDGDLSTFEPDYYDWALSINDAHDRDQDGIPDFSDDTGSIPPRAPTLAVSLAPSTVVFSVSGTVGWVHEIQAATSLALQDWTAVQSITLSSDPQSVSLSRPEVGARFWRVRIP